MKTLALALVLAAAIPAASYASDDLGADVATCSKETQKHDPKFDAYVDGRGTVQSVYTVALGAAGPFYFEQCLTKLGWSKK